MSSSQIVYRPRPDATQEAEVNALCAVYAYLLNERATKHAPELSGRDDKQLARKERRPA